MTVKYRLSQIYKSETNQIYPQLNQAEEVIPAFKGYSNKAWDNENFAEPHDKNLQSITSILIDSDVDSLNALENRLNHHCPYIVIKGKISCMEHANMWITNKCPDLVFLSVGSDQKNNFHILKENKNKRFETIFITEKDYLDIRAFQHNISGCLHKPIQELQLLKVMQHVQQKIMVQKESIKNKNLLENLLSIQSQKDVIGIPTIEGYEFLPVEQIICCEGMNKCTKLITTTQSNIVSSYNIGEFGKLLLPFGFFSPHKSFLVNLSKIKKYNKEGTLTMSSGHHIPLARRKKESFLWNIKKDKKFPIIHQ